MCVRATHPNPSLVSTVFFRIAPRQRVVEVVEGQVVQPEDLLLPPAGVLVDHVAGGRARVPRARARRGRWVLAAAAAAQLATCGWRSVSTNLTLPSSGSAALTTRSMVGVGPPPPAQKSIIIHDEMSGTSRLSTDATTWLGGSGCSGGARQRPRQREPGLHARAEPRREPGNMSGQPCRVLCGRRWCVQPDGSDGQVLAYHGWSSISQQVHPRNERCHAGDGGSSAPGLGVFPRLVGGDERAMRWTAN